MNVGLQLYVVNIGSKAPSFRLLFTPRLRPKQYKNDAPSGTSFRSDESVFHKICEISVQILGRNLAICNKVISNLSEKIFTNEEVSRRTCVIRSL